MGIKFLCPNGHKLNVKSFLAGKKGVCPKCGISLRIPAASESEAEDSGAGLFEVPAVPSPAASTTPAAQGMGTLSPASPVIIPPAPAPKLPAAAVPITPGQSLAVGTATAMPVPAMPSPAGMSAPGMALPGKPQPETPQAASGYPGIMPAMPQQGMAPHPAMPQPGMPLPGYGNMPSAPAAYGPADSIAEAPAATWYVRPPAGNQYGPARGDVMRKWIAEGRVSADSLVWREGWTDWRSAGQVFPNLATAGDPGGGATSPASSATTASRPARYQPRKKSGTGMAVAFLVLLALACIVLVGVLVYVLSTQATS